MKDLYFKVINTQKITNFTEIECDNCHNHRTVEEFNNLNLGGYCLKCYQKAEKEAEDMQYKVRQLLGKQIII